jgi:dynein heavy chain
LCRRCRQFPALVNCCTIDWYAPWPQEALTSVATSLLASAELGGGAEGTAVAGPGGAAAAGGQAGQCELVAKVAAMCVHVHTSVEAASERMYQELHRR